MEHAAFVPSVPWIVPFAALLVALAILPLAAPHFWESNLRKLAVSLAPGVPVMLLYLTNAPHALVETTVHYISFIVLLGSLFVISGGVLMDGDLEATPRVNTLFLAVGALLASFVGTKRVGSGPGFGGYLLYSTAVLFPVFVIVTLVFFT